MGDAGVQGQLHRHAGPAETPGVLQALVAEDVQLTDLDVRGENTVRVGVGEPRGRRVG